METKINLLSLYSGVSFYTKFLGSNAVSDSLGAKFLIPLNTEEGLRNGSVQIIVNGVYFLSNTDQTDIQIDSDFHIEDSVVVIHNTSNGGSIDLNSDDLIGVYFQKEVS
ncbi:hypothetical protein H8D85_01715 [bacterium]|nr:hypothetical protein [bacterium]